MFIFGYETNKQFVEFPMPVEYRIYALGFIRYHIKLSGTVLLLLVTE
jgi:hypothetical protein